MRKKAEAPAVDRRRALEAVAKRFKDFKPAREVLSRVRAVPTIFAQFDHATGVGGLPIERFMLVHGPSGHGKAQPSDEPVLTPSGWRPIGEIQVGDRVVGRDGGSYAVDGVFPQGELDLFRVTFSDGTSTECCEEHLWATRTAVEWSLGRYVRGPRPIRRRIPTGVDAPFRVRTLHDIASTIDAKHEVPMVRPVHYEPVGELPIDPYALGLLLGDGGFTGTSPMFHKPELDLWSSLEQRLPGRDRLGKGNPKRGSVIIVGKETRRRLANLGLYGLRSHEKFVPELYKLADPADRLALLRGLFDTDGHVAKEGGVVEFGSSSRKLFDDVVEIARGLGAYVTVQSRNEPVYTYLGERKIGRPAWRALVAFLGGEVPVASKKNLSRWKGRGSSRRKTIVGVEWSRRASATCIRVKAPDRLYVTRDFIVTHNTQFALGLVRSFLERDHFALYVDAERTTPWTWVEELLGASADHPGFFGKRPRTYEDTVEEVRRFVTTLAQARDAGELPEDTSALVVVDSLRKLVPEGILKKISKDDGGVDGMGGRAAQMKAAMNAAWLDELVPLLEDTGTAVVAIARESEDPNADAWARRSGNDFRVGGGKAVYYDASLVMRVERASYVGDKDGDVRTTYGERMRVTIRKTKIAGREDRQTVCYFHSSNGVLVPRGFDRARDVLELGERFGVVKAKGAWLHWGRQRWNGRHAAAEKIAGDAACLAGLEAEVRAKFAKETPVEVTADGEVVDG